MRKAFLIILISAIVFCGYAFAKMPPNLFGIYERGFINELAQKYTDFDETDAAEVVTITDTIITLTAGDRDTDYYAARSYGSDFFGDFTHWVDVNITSLANDAASLMYSWGVADVVDDFNDIDGDSGDCIFIGIGRITDADHYTIIAYNVDGGAITNSAQTPSVSVDTVSYLSITRSETSLTVQVYSTSALRAAGAAGDVSTLTLTVVNTEFEYLYGIGSYNNAGTAKDISGTAANLVIR